MHAEEDKKKRQLAELRNQADSMCYQVEKLMKEHADKIKDADKAPLEAAIEKTREVAKTDNVEAIKSAVAELEQASHALSKTLYETQPDAPERARAAGDGKTAAKTKSSTPSSRSRSKVGDRTLPAVGWTAVEGCS